MRAVVLSRGLLAELPEFVGRWAKGVGPKTISALTIEQLDAITRHMTEAVASLEQPMADVEFALTSGAGDGDDIHGLGLQIADLRRHLSPFRVIVNRLVTARPMWLVGDSLSRLNAIADDLRNAEDELQNLLARIVGARGFMSDRRAAQMNDVLYVLTLVSTVMLPLTFITGVLGMNVGISGASYSGMSSTLAFLVVCAALAILGGVVYRFLGRQGLLLPWSRVSRGTPESRPAVATAPRE
jgi:zinc transporter